MPRRNSDAEMRLALRRWRANQGDGELALRLLGALDRAGLLPDSTGRPERSARKPARRHGVGRNMTEVDVGDVVGLVSYDTPVAFLSRGSTTAYVIDPMPSPTTARHIRTWLASHGVLGQEPASAEEIAEMLGG